MIKIPANFELDRYGIHVRLVREEDAEFIVKLRTDPQHARFLGHTDNNVSKQVEWMREYKNVDAKLYKGRKDFRPFFSFMWYKLTRMNLDH